ncbi:MAG: septum formation initiator family protein [Candidatus Paceibacterota bacterium]
MSEFNRKNKYNFWHSPLILIVLFCILILFAYNIIGLIEKERETTEKKNVILSNIETLRNREKTLSNDIGKLKTEEGVEETIRDKYQVVKEGEKMVVIVDEEKKENPLLPEETKHGFVEWIKRMFGMN